MEKIIDKSYRNIFKWGDKREQHIEKHMIRVIKEKFDLTDESFSQKHLPGNTIVKDLQPSKLSSTIIEELHLICGKENVETDDFSRASRSYGKYYMDLLSLRKGIVQFPPDAVVFPRSEEEAEKVLKICILNRIPLVPAGGLSSVTGGTIPEKNGILLDTTRHLNKIIEINPTNQTVTAQAGISGPQLEEELNKAGFSCGHFPQSFEYSTLGGWVAAKGAGQASTGYGKIEDMVLALKVLTPSGVFENKVYPKTAQAWDIYPMFIGSEGSLGIITRVTMKIRKFRPKNTHFASFVFKSFEDSVEAMRDMIQSGIGTPHLFRISDPMETDIAFKTKGFDNTFNDRVLKSLGYKPEKRVLMFVSVEGHRSYAKKTISLIRKKAGKYHALYIGKKPVKHWLSQRYSSAYLRDPLMDAGIMADTLETAVMWDKLMDLWEAVQEYTATRPKTVMMIHISHVYENGANLYFTFLSPMKKGDEENDYLTFHKGLIETISANHGSLSHHHGIGKVLARGLEKEIGKTAYNMLSALKKHVDPDNIMNPGTIFRE